MQDEDLNLMPFVKHVVLLSKQYKYDLSDDADKLSKRILIELFNLKQYQVNDLKISPSFNKMINNISVSDLYDFIKQSIFRYMLKYKVGLYNKSIKELKDENILLNFTKDLQGFEVSYLSNNNNFRVCFFLDFKSIIKNNNL